MFVYVNCVNNFNDINKSFFFKIGCWSKLIYLFL